MTLVTTNQVRENVTQWIELLRKFETFSFCWEMKPVVNGESLYDQRFTVCNLWDLDRITSDTLDLCFCTFQVRIQGTTSQLIACAQMLKTCWDSVMRLKKPETTGLFGPSGWLDIELIDTEGLEIHKFSTLPAQWMYKGILLDKLFNIPERFGWCEICERISQVFEVRFDNREWSIGRGIESVKEERLHPYMDWEDIRNAYMIQEFEKKYVGETRLDKLPKHVRELIYKRVISQAPKGEEFEYQAYFERLV